MKPNQLRGALLADSWSSHSSLMKPVCARVCVCMFNARQHYHLQRWYTQKTRQPCTVIPNLTPQNAEFDFVFCHQEVLKHEFRSSEVSPSAVDVVRARRKW